MRVAPFIRYPPTQPTTPQPTQPAQFVAEWLQVFATPRQPPRPELQANPLNKPTHEPGQPASKSPLKQSYCPPSKSKGYINEKANPPTQPYFSALTFSQPALIGV